MPKISRLCFGNAPDTFFIGQSAARINEKLNPIWLIIITLPIIRSIDFDGANRLIFIPLIQLPILTTDATFAELNPAFIFAINKFYPSF